MLYKNLFSYDLEVGYKFSPDLYLNVVSRWPDMSDYLLRTDSRGYRNDLKTTRNEGYSQTLTNVFAGCSFTAGDGVSNSQRFSNLYSTHSLNLAIPGSCFRQQLIVLIKELSGKRVHNLFLTPFIGCIYRMMDQSRTFKASSLQCTFYKPFLTKDVHGYTIQQAPPPRVALLNSENRLVTHKKRILRSVNSYLSLNERAYMSPGLLSESIHLAKMLTNSVDIQRVYILPIPNLIILKNAKPSFYESVNSFFLNIASIFPRSTYYDPSGELRPDCRSLYFSEGHFNPFGHTLFADILRAKTQ